MEMDKPMIRRILGFMMSVSLLLGLLPGLSLTAYARETDAGDDSLHSTRENGDTAFTGCTGLIAVYAPAGGTTEAWCMRVDIPFVGE